MCILVSKVKLVGHLPGCSRKYRLYWVELVAEYAKTLSSSVHSLVLPRHMFLYFYFSIINLVLLNKSVLISHFQRMDIKYMVYFNGPLMSTQNLAVAY